MMEKKKATGGCEWRTIQWQAPPSQGFGLAKTLIGLI
jgi:hypothetical protein